MENPILKYFSYEHLPENLQTVSKPVCELAASVEASLPNGPEKSAGLRKLLEAKDCFVRASLGVLIFAILLCAPTMAQTPRWTVTGTITGSAQTVTIPSQYYDIVTTTIHGTYAGVVLVFEFSDDGGTTWYPDQCTRSDTPLIESGETIASNATLEWDCGVVATTNFRVRSTAYTSGTATINLTMTQDQIEPAATEQISPTAATPLVLNAAGAATTVKAASGYVAGLTLLNNNAAAVFVEFFNTNTVTLGTTTPVLAFPIPALSTLTISPSTFALANFNTAISVAAVTAYNGSTTGSVTGTVFYF